MTIIAPICPVSRDQAVSGQPPAEVALVPVTDLPSAIAALNQMALILKALPENNVAPKPAPAVSGGTPGVDGGGGKSKRAGWMEISRTTDKVSVHNPDDPSISVELTRVTDLLFRENKTGARLAWHL